MLSVHAGGAAFTDFQRGTAIMASPHAELREFRLRRRVSAKTTGTAGGSVALWLGNAWGLRAGAAYAPSSFAVRNDDAVEKLLAQAPRSPQPSYAALGIFTADVSVLFRPAFTFGRVVPYGIAGLGLVRYWRADAGELPPEARARFGSASSTGPAAVVGVGGAIPLQMGNLMLTFELTDHITRTPLDDMGAGEEFELAGMALQLEPAQMRSDTDGVGVTNNVRLVVGLTLPLTLR